MRYEEILEIAPFSMERADKQRLLDERLLALTRYHYAHCEEYRKMLDATGVDVNNMEHYVLI